MCKPKRLIVVTASYDPLRRKVMRVVNKVASERGLEVEVREEDWVFLVRHGEKDELGGAPIPQVFVECEDGTIRHALTRIPLDERGKPDPQAAERAIVSALGG